MKEESRPARRLPSKNSDGANLTARVVGVPWRGQSVNTSSAPSTLAGERFSLRARKSRLET